MKRGLLLAALFLASSTTASAAPDGLHFGLLRSGPLDGITDVPGVRVAHLTKIEGTNVRTGATVIFPNDDPWNLKVSAAAQPYNGNGEMTGTNWVNESGYLEVPIVLTDTLDVGRADDGVIGWMMHRFPQVGLHDDVPLPVVAECDDQLLNAIRLRTVSASDIETLLDQAKPGQFARGSVGAGTGMRAFGFKAGIGSASRVIDADLGGYTVGVLVNDNTGSSRELLQINGVHVGAALKNEYLPVYPKRTGMLPLRPHGRQVDGSIVVIVATNAPLDSRQLRAVTKRIELGMARVGLTSQVGSGDLFLAFSTTYQYKRDKDFAIHAPENHFIEDEDALNQLYLATIEATENAIYDALFSSKTTSGNGITIYGMPIDRVKALLERP